MEPVTIIGGGLAGCEAAWQAANRNCKVRLIDMKPLTFSPVLILLNWSAAIPSDLTTSTLRLVF